MIPRILANDGDQTREIGSDRKIGYPNVGDTPGLAQLPVASLARQNSSQGSKLRAMKEISYP